MGGTQPFPLISSFIGMLLRMWGEFSATDPGRPQISDLLPLSSWAHLPVSYIAFLDVTSVTLDLSDDLLQSWNLFLKCYNLQDRSCEWFLIPCKLYASDFTRQWPCFFFSLWSRRVTRRLTLLEIFVTARTVCWAISCRVPIPGHAAQSTTVYG